MNLDFYKTTLEKAGVIFESGLNETEILAAEQFYKFIFPPDLKEFLMFALPVSKRWMNWRQIGSEEIKAAFDHVYGGIYFDIEMNDFWLKEWGDKPSDLSDATAIAKEKIDDAPKLIPVCGHRYIPASPSESGNPVFSVWQTDIIYYGSDLRNYFENEFYYYFQTLQYQLNEPIKEIEFWSYLVERNYSHSIVEGGFDEMS